MSDLSYEEILAALKAKRNELDKAIVALEAIITPKPLYVPTTGSLPPWPGPTRLPYGQFPGCGY